MQPEIISTVCMFDIKVVVYSCNALDYVIISLSKYLGWGLAVFTKLFECADKLEKFAYLDFSSRYMVCLPDKTSWSQCSLCLKSNTEIQQNTRLV
jgi:hypothetical protein